MLLGDITGQQFVDRALRVGRDLRDRPLAVVLLCKEPDSETTAEAELERILKPLRLPIVLADIGDHVLSVVGLGPQVSVEQLTAHLAKHRARAGVSRSCTAAQLADGAHQARTAASVAASSEDSGPVAFDRLGVLGVAVAGGARGVAGVGEVKLRSVKATLRETKSLKVAFTDLRQTGTCGGRGTGYCWGG